MHKPICGTCGAPYHSGRVCREEDLDRLGAFTKTALIAKLLGQLVYLRAQATFYRTLVYLRRG